MSPRRPLRPVKRLLQHADRRLSISRRRAAGGRPRALFEVANEFGYLCQAPVLSELARRGNLDLSCTSATVDLGRLTAPGAPLPARPISPRAAKWGRWDGVIATDHPKIRYQRLAKFIYQHHGSSFANLSPPYALGALREGPFTALLCLARAEAAMLTRLDPATTARSELRVAGAPKLDALVRGAFDREAVLRRLGLDPARRTIFVSSHWHPRDILRSRGLEVVRELARIPGINLIAGAHNHLWNVASEWLSGGVDWYAGLQEVCRGPNARVVREVDSRPLLQAADLLVAGYSSLALEYSALYRPMLIYWNPEHPMADPEYQRRLLATAESFSDERGLGDRALGLLGAEPDRERRAALLDYSLDYLGAATARTADAVEGLLGVGGDGGDA